MEIIIEQLKTFSPGINKVFNDLLDQLSPGFKIFSDEDVKKIIAEPSNHLFVAKDFKDTKIVGMVMIVIVNTLLRRKALLEELVVDENYRENGIGKKLIDFAINQARKEGAVHLELTSNPKRIEANKLYQELGFEKRDTNVYRIEL